ncbi:MAG: apolipoprotein N-acyltransferase [Cytophagales bacterium]|nr:apolipoprotein N-acyltransferase [Cytophagales bacterium]MDW8383218.1 apolipoprotein N-acyltransferase [Flammeovirgaceae bacterium]
MYKRYYYLLFLSITSATALSLAWYPYFTALVFVGLVPILEAERYIYENFVSPQKVFFLFSFCTLLLWNIGVYWWLWNASGFTTLAAWIANALLQCIPLMLFQWGKLRIHKKSFQKILWICCWLGFEYLHLNWDFSWVWLNLGNAFANTPSWVQWYEYTGALGGTLWILIVNWQINNTIRKAKGLVFTFLTIILPILISYIILWRINIQGKPIEVVVVQPNIDTYTEKFNYNAKTGEPNPNSMPYDEQIQRMLQTAQTVTTDSTIFILFPETALHLSKNESYTDNYPDIRSFRHWQELHFPKSSIVVGADTYLKYDNPQTSTARYSNEVGYYDVFNSAIFLQKDAPAQHYKKSELVIGVETIPFPTLFRWLMLNLGGTVGSLGRQAHQVPFCRKDSICIAPVICYESVYGETVAEFVRNGAHLIGIITNDDWWGDTPGYRQHLAFARLRAIETRRYIARAANTGISAFITPTGQFLEMSSYKQKIALRQTVLACNHLTWYAKTGDSIGKVAAFLAIFMLLSVLVKKRTSFRKSRLKHF